MSAMQHVSSPRATQWLTRKQAALYLQARGCGISCYRLERMACHENDGRGPPYTRTGWRTVRYHVDDLDRWISANTVRVGDAA